MEEKYYEVDPRSIVVRDGWNPRTDFTHVDEWKESIRQVGVQEPLKIKPTMDGTVHLVSGETRLRSILILLEEGVTKSATGSSLEKIPVLAINQYEDDSDTYIRTVVENSHTPLNPLDEAMSFLRLRQDNQMTLKEIATLVGRGEQYVADRLVLVDASPEVRAALEKKTIGVVRATEIVRNHRKRPDRQAEAIQEHTSPAPTDPLPPSLDECADFLYRFLYSRRGWERNSQDPREQVDTLYAFARGMARGLEIARLDTSSVQFFQEMLSRGLTGKVEDEELFLQMLDTKLPGEVKE